MPNILRRTGAAGLMLWAALALPAAPAHAAISVALTPTNHTVTPGTDFDLFVEVPSSGSAFNGYELVVEYDPAVLTFLPLAPTSSQQGCLMTGGCSAACGNTFHQFAAASDSLKINNVLLCNLISLTGPGQLYRLRFHATNTPQATLVKVRRVRFFDAGLLVQPVSSSDAVIGVGVAVSVGDVPVLSAVRAEPNPSRGSVAFVTSRALAEAGGIEVLDLQGRLIRRLGTMSSSGQPLLWDGKDAQGARVPPGVYLARIHLADGIQNLRVVLLP